MKRRLFTALVLVTMLLAAPALATPPPYTSARESVSTTFDLSGGESSGNAEASAQTGEFFLYARTSSDAPTGVVLPPVSFGANRSNSFVELVKRDQGALTAGQHQVTVEMDLTRVRTQATGASSSSLFVNVVSYASYCNPDCGTNSSPIVQEYLGCSWNSSYCLPRAAMTIRTQVNCPGTCASITTYVWIYATAHSSGPSGYAESIGDGTVKRIDQ